MNVWAIAAVSILYGWASVSYAIKGDWAWAVFWMGYSVANTAFLIATRGTH